MGAGRPTTGPAGDSPRSTARTAAVAVLVYATIGLFMALVVRNTTLPDEAAGMNAIYGPFNAFLQETSGKRVTTDFQVDFASAVALLHGEDPYGVTADIIDRYGMPPWDVALANPHPPTTVVLVLPFALLGYQNALTAWTLLMVFAVVGTIQLMGVRLAYAAPIGVAICVLFPGAYAIGNVVPVIGLGVALAYRFRDRPVLAALGLTLAAAPKASGLLLVLPFLLTMRWRPVAWTAGFMAALALLPVAFFPATWNRYLDVGVYSVTRNAARGDNTAVLSLAERVGIPSWVAGAALIALAVLAALVVRDCFWPVVWLTVALLPIMWMYSLITLLPLFCVVLRRPSPWAVGSVVAGATLAIGSPPLGETYALAAGPLVVLCAFVGLLQVRDDGFWPRPGQLAALVRRAPKGAPEPPPSLPRPVPPR